MQDRITYKNSTELSIGDIFHLKSAGDDVFVCYKAENFIGIGESHSQEILARPCLRNGFVYDPVTTKTITTKEPLVVFGNDVSGLSKSALVAAGHLKL